MDRNKNKSIWKFPLVVADVQSVPVPYGAFPLCVQVQNGTPCLWAEVDPLTKRKDTIQLFTIGTGHPIPEAAQQYLGTYQLDGGRLVFHVYLGD